MAEQSIPDQLAAAFLAYARVLKDAADDPASFSGARTVQGESLDEAFERLYGLACQQLGLDPESALDPSLSVFQELLMGFANSSTERASP